MRGTRNTNTSKRWKFQALTCSNWKPNDPCFIWSDLVLGTGYGVRKDVQSAEKLFETRHCVTSGMWKGLKRHEQAPSAAHPSRKDPQSSTLLQYQETVETFNAYFDLKLAWPRSGRERRKFPVAGMVRKCHSKFRPWSWHATFLWHARTYPTSSSPPPRTPADMPTPRMPKLGASRASEKGKGWKAKAEGGPMIEILHVMP